MRPIDGESSDEDLYQWFIAALAEEFGSAVEVKPGVIEVVDDPPTRDPRPYELHISREQLRSAAWSETNMFDDSQGDVTVASTNPVFDGLDHYFFATMESMASGGPFSRYYVFDEDVMGGGMRRSVRPDSDG